MWISKQEYDESGPSIVHRKCVAPAPHFTIRTILIKIQVFLSLGWRQVVRSKPCGSDVNIKRRFVRIRDVGLKGEDSYSEGKGSSAATNMRKEKAGFSRWFFSRYPIFLFLVTYHDTALE